MQIKKSDPAYQKMKSFIEKLLSNQNFENQTITEKEDSVLKFFIKSEEQLKPNFQSQAYFPDLDWSSIKALFFTVLREYVIDKIRPEIDIIAEYINFSVVRVVAEGPLEDYKTLITNFYKKIITHKEVRSEYPSVSKGIKINLFSKYLAAFKERQGYGTKELFKNKQLQNIEDFSHFLKICLILRNILNIRIPMEVNKQNKNMTYDNVKTNPLLKRDFFKKINGIFKAQFQTLPELFIKTSLNSIIDKDEATADIDNVSMFLKILAERSKEIINYQKIDKGAESPDKSWFNIARRNHAYYGFDIKLLDEFYFIASEKNW